MSTTQKHVELGGKIVVQVPIEVLRCWYERAEQIWKVSKGGVANYQAAMLMSAIENRIKELEASRG